jgi:hypothetical protein
VVSLQRIFTLINDLQKKLVNLSWKPIFAHKYS